MGVPLVVGGITTTAGTEPPTIEATIGVLRDAIVDREVATLFAAHTLPFE